jgi:hypothetical protein
MSNNVNWREEWVKARIRESRRANPDITDYALREEAKADADLRVDLRGEWIEMEARRMQEAGEYLSMEECRFHAEVKAAQMESPTYRAADQALCELHNAIRAYGEAIHDPKQRHPTHTRVQEALAAFETAIRVDQQAQINHLVADAPRYHSGGVPGLKPGGVIGTEPGETPVLPKSNINVQLGSGLNAATVTLANVIDGLLHSAQLQMHHTQDEVSLSDLYPAWDGRRQMMRDRDPYYRIVKALADARDGTISFPPGVVTFDPPQKDDHAKRYDAVCDILDELKLAVFDVSDGAIRDTAMKFNGKALRKTGNTLFNVGVTPEYALAWYVLRVMEKGA